MLGPARCSWMSSGDREEVAVNSTDAPGINNQGWALLCPSSSAHVNDVSGPGQAQATLAKMHENSWLAASHHCKQHQSTATCAAAEAFECPTGEHSASSTNSTPAKLMGNKQHAVSPLNPNWRASPPFSSASMASPQHTYLDLSRANSAGSVSTQSISSCNGLSLAHIVKKYKRAKSLLQAHIHEVQRLKDLAAIEAQKALTAANQARTLESQLADSTAAVVEARVAQQQLEQQVRNPSVVLQALLGVCAKMRVDNICTLILSVVHSKTYT